MIDPREKHLLRLAAYRSVLVEEAYYQIGMPVVFSVLILPGCQAPDLWLNKRH